MQVNRVINQWLGRAIGGVGFVQMAVWVPCLMLMAIPSQADCFLFNQDLKLGTDNPSRDVQELQRLLTSQGYDVKGEKAYGPYTARATLNLYLDLKVKFDDIPNSWSREKELPFYWSVNFGPVFNRSMRFVINDRVNELCKFETKIYRHYEIAMHALAPTYDQIMQVEVKRGEVMVLEGVNFEGVDKYRVFIRTAPDKDGRVGEINPAAVFVRNPRKMLLKIPQIPNGDYTISVLSDLGESNSRKFIVK